MQVAELQVWDKERKCLHCGKRIVPREPLAYDHYHYACSREVLKK